MKTFTLNKFIFASLFAFGLTLIGSIPPVFAAGQTQAQATQCYKVYDGKQLADETYLQDYLKSSCADEKNGNCSEKSVGTGGTTYHNIQCSRKAGLTPAEVADEKNDSVQASGCGAIKTSIIKCNNTGGNPLMSILIQVINFLAVGVGIAVVGGIIWGGMLYASSNGDSSKTKQGITTIVNSVIGLLLFIFMYAIINYLVPGGLFN